MSCDLKQLVRLMRQCEADTGDIIGKPAANMLAYWLHHEGNLERLVRFIHDRIHGPTKSPGWKLRQNQRLSLEEIVALRCPQLFTERDIQVAKQTLRLQ